MPWLYLFVAGLFEIVWAIALKQAHGFSKLWPSVTTALGLVFSFLFLSSALKSLPVGTAYAVWTGIGAIGVAAMGIYLFGESAAPGRLFCMAMIVTGIIGLRIIS